MKFGQDARVSVLSYQSLSLWLLGYTDAATRLANEALSEAREINHAVTLIYGLGITVLSKAHWANNEAVNLQLDEAIRLADEKGAAFWKTLASVLQGCVWALNGKASDAIHTITSGIAGLRLTGATMWMTWFHVCLARAYADVGKIDAAWASVTEALTAVEATNERWYEAEVLRTAGEITLMTTAPMLAKAEGYFQRALFIARTQQAKSWELRAATSMARLLRGQNQPQRAYDVLAPVYGWFTEGLNTPDLLSAREVLETILRSANEPTSQGE